MDLKVDGFWSTKGQGVRGSFFDRGERWLCPIGWAIGVKDGLL